MEDTKRIYGLCPKCKKGYLVKETLFNGIIFNRQKIEIFFCPQCDFKNKIVFKLNEQQYQEEIN
jgi:ssDNA-binding Zn-finger/Zn-ribbon topoisomerase 1